MIKTRIFQFVGHIHNMQLCIEMISFINHENESTLRWFYSFCEPRNFSLCPRRLVGVYSGGLGVWFMTFCCCPVEFGFSCFNHASIESWFVWYSIWYSALIFYTSFSETADAEVTASVKRFSLCVVNKSVWYREQTAPYPFESLSWMSNTEQSAPHRS